MKKQMQSHLRRYADGVLIPCYCPDCEGAASSLAAVAELRQQMSVPDRIRADAAACIDMLEAAGMGQRPGQPNCLTDQTREIIAERDQLRAQLQEALDALRNVVEIVQHCVPPPSHPGSCGPESDCDAGCIDLDIIAREIRQAEAVLANRGGEAVKLALLFALAFTRSVVVDGVEYSLLVSPVTCESIQTQDCHPMPPARRANVTVREGKRLVRAVGIDCRSAGCKDEDWESVVRKALR